MAATIAPDRDLRTEAGGRVLLGGHPFRVLRLSAGGAQRVRSWFGGQPPAANQAETDLATRLVEAGLAHPRPAPCTIDCHIVIPFHGDDHELRDTIEVLRSSGAASITVVDDGSEPPIPEIEGITIIRHEHPMGPGAARNTGWRFVATHTPDSAVVAFVDGGVLAPPTGSGEEPNWLDQLCGHLTDEGVIAAAPRVASIPGTSLIERYEALFSPLDLGPQPSLVGPGRRVTYVPTACLIVDMAALVSADGFDESMRYGEDVDLVWRLSLHGQVRYDPAVVVQHGPRNDVRALALQRFHYATAAAALDDRHRGASAPWKSSIVGCAGVVLLSLGRPISGFLIGLAPVTLLADQLQQTSTPRATSIRLLAAGHRWALRSFAESMSRTWSCMAFVSLVVPGVRTASILWMMAGWARRVGATRSPEILALGVVDDVAYGIGALTGAIRHRSLRSLLPAISRWG